MSGRFLLDTNIVIALFAGEQSIIDSLKQANEIFIPYIVIGELYYGAQKSGKSQTNLNRVDEFVQTNVILDSNHETAQWYGQLKNQLKKKGRPIPENDIWIAALAFQYNLTLVTRDSHFDEISSITIEIW